ncbi:LamG-like jellyroll fold domain-containing protein [Massilia phyllosphaerae]|uniref:LamG-like jellyroll fold domain-containing protein n=1 Tax=Massilia phyllosphaerae TaxID=3106034 RepID=UPI002B1CC6D1|nr:LamG-like jellyroll fold domain-containing protein [Massilia sp. SGZ-792]
MPTLSLPARYTQQPPPSAPVDAGNRISRGLTFAKSNPGSGARAARGVSNPTAPLTTEIKRRGLSTRFTGYGGGTVDTLGNIGKSPQGTVLVLHQSTLLPPNGGFPNPGYSHVLAATISGATSANGWLLMLGNGNGYLQFRAFDASDNGTQVAGADGTVPLNDGKPHTTVATWDLTSGGALATYVDGIPYATANVSSPASSAQPMRIGGSRETQQFWGKLDGNIYLVLVWDRILTPREIRTVSGNPWQVFAAPRRLLWAAATQASAAALAWTEAGDATSITTLLTNNAATAWMEGGESASIASVVTDRGALSWTEQGDAQTITVAAASPPMAVAAALLWAEADDSASLVARLTNRAAVAITEQGDAWALSAYAERPPVINLTVRFNVLPRDFRTKITHFSN